jgi:hypothetical protein
MLDLDKASSYCSDQVKYPKLLYFNVFHRKFDFYSWIAGQSYPKSLQPYYFGAHALFIEALKSREISRETSICQTRLLWWEQSLIDIEEGRGLAKEPVTRVLQEAKAKTAMNLKVLIRLVNFQLFDIERGDI